MYFSNDVSVSSELLLDFETDATSKLIEDSSQRDQWKRVQAKDTPALVDTTLSTGRGHVLYFLQTDRRPGYKARRSTLFMDTTGQCLQFMYKYLGEGTELTVCRNLRNQ